MILRQYTPLDHSLTSFVEWEGTSRLAINCQQSGIINQLSAVSRGGDYLRRLAVGGQLEKEKALSFIKQCLLVFSA